ncbi:MAG: Agmatine deiminase [Myxococcota bacterium]|nr:Agmatine deiminase [Myxococcota bacterium]
MPRKNFPPPAPPRDESAPTPAALGFRMPAEWEPHEATWLTWPRDPITWPGKVPFAEQCMARWVREITADSFGRRPEIARINVHSKELRKRAKEILDDWAIPLERVEFHLHPNNDVWIRDYGPSFVTRRKDPGDGYGTRAMIHWRFDGWGGKGADYYGSENGLDARIPGLIAARRNIHRFTPDVILEGGSFEVDGAGTLLTTSECLLDHRLHPGVSAAEKQNRLEADLAAHLGVRNFIWLREEFALDGDDTDGHVDNIARFAGPGVIVTIIAPERRHPLYQVLKRNRQLLDKARDAQGKPYAIAEIPLPPNLEYRITLRGRRTRRRYPASYANFYIANRCVLVPVYACQYDLPALDVLGKLFPDRQIIPVDCCDYILGQGAIHCSTQQEPAV